MNAIEPGRGRRSLEIPTHLNLSAKPSAELMVTLLAPTLNRAARRYESDAQRCSDLQQEMLIALWLSLDTFEGRTSFRTWVNGVAHRVGTQHVTERRLSRRRSEPLRRELESLPTPHDPESILATRERALAALNLLDGLRKREREVVMLHLQEFELDEMSNEMKICRTQVRETLIRARRRLAMRMKKTEQRGAPEVDLPLKLPLEDEAPPQRVSGKRAFRSSRDQGGVYFIEPRQTKVRADGCA
jgi:RNA polymerase sigma-70 factor (ECF subfamily)